MLLDGRRLSLSYGYDWIEPMPPDFLPELSTGPARVSTAATAWRDSGDKTLKMQPKPFSYAYGEVSVFYGTSTGGKFSREVKQGHIFGEMGNDKTRISVVRVLRGLERSRSAFRALNFFAVAMLDVCFVAAVYDRRNFCCGMVCR